MSDLRYVSTSIPGFRRIRWGRGFTYRTPSGETVQDKALKHWFKSLVIPPAWTEVWICPFKNGHVLATGRDTKGRKQYRYHPEWENQRNKDKFDQLYMFGQALPTIRVRTTAALADETLSKEKVISTVVRLLETTLIRIGNEAYADSNASYGLTTLQDEHVDFTGQGLLFDFVGKSGKEHQIGLENEQLMEVIRHCQELPGYDLFQYMDADGEIQDIESGDINRYLQEITGEEITAKFFRTWGGSTLAIHFLISRLAVDNRAKAVRECTEFVSQALGNTVAVTKKYYIHPGIFELFLRRELDDLVAIEDFDGEIPGSLDQDEKILMHLIRMKSRE